jgi:hypothetical protein
LRLDPVKRRDYSNQNALLTRGRQSFSAALESPRVKHQLTICCALRDCACLQP